MDKLKKAVAFTIILCSLLSSMAGCNKNTECDVNEDSKITTEKTTTVRTEDDITETEIDKSNTESEIDNTIVETQEESSIKETSDTDINFDVSTTFTDTIEDSDTTDFTTDGETDTNTESSEDSSETEEETSLSPQEIEYKKFQDSVDSNVYDKWLEEKLAEGINSPNNIYAKYLALWKNELSYTIEGGSSLFENSSKYETWKTNLEEWLNYTSTTLRLEMNQFFGSMEQLEVIIPHCELVRQKVIDTKYFLYKLEIQNAMFEDASITFPDISIKWRLNNISDISNEDTTTPPKDTEEETTAPIEEEIAKEIENIANSHPTLDEFKAAYPNFRTVSESLDGTYDYVSLTAKELPDATFTFKRHFGENGYSKITLSYISVPAYILLPQYLDMKFSDIVALEGDLATLTEYDDGTTNLYIYRENFYYNISGQVHASTLGTYEIQIKTYNDMFLSPIKKEVSINKNLETTDLLEFLSKERCSYEEFQKAFTNLTVISKDESSITVRANSLPNIEFNFCILKDSRGKTQIVLNYIRTTAEVIFPNFVGVEVFDLRAVGMETADASKYNDRTLFYYDNNCSFVLKLESDVLLNNTTVYIIPYTDSWVRPW